MRCWTLRLASITNRWAAFPLGLLCLAIALSSGCGSGTPTVSGTLTLDGKPLAASDTVRVTLMFYPEGGGAPAAALADANGRYELSTGGQVGVAQGRYVAVVSAVETSGAAGGGAPQKKILTPAKYADPKQSGLVADVKPGNNTINFDLKSQP